MDWALLWLISQLPNLGSLQHLCLELDDQDFETDDERVARAWITDNLMDDSFRRMILDGLTYRNDWYKGILGCKNRNAMRLVAVLELVNDHEHFCEMLAARYIQSALLARFVACKVWRSFFCSMFSRHSVWRERFCRYSHDTKQNTTSFNPIFRGHRRGPERQYHLSEMCIGVPMSFRVWVTGTGASP